MMVDLGTIKNVDLREVWPNEATDFTPWLEKHLQALGDALGMDLEFKQREASVGDFSLDLLARDVGRNCPVVIENQLTPTDHDHLGKLLTYAGGRDAGVLIWLCKEMREEHRQALDWLNQRTDEKTEFFGVVVEALKIDDSRPAPNFKLVAFPNAWRKTVVVQREPVSERMEAYRSYFQDLIDRLREEHKFTGARKAPANSYYFFSSGVSGFSYGASFTKEKQARVELYIDPSDAAANKAHFDSLARRKESSQSEFSDPLDWERLDDRIASRISLNRPGTIDDDSEALEEINSWMISNLLKFRDVFGPQVAQLKG